MFLDKFLKDCGLSNLSGKREERAPRLFSEEPHSSFNLTLENQTCEDSRAVSCRGAIRVL